MQKHPLASAGHYAGEINASESEHRVGVGSVQAGTRGFVFRKLGRTAG